jgi:WD40 repeat protein
VGFEHGRLHEPLSRTLGTGVFICGHSTLGGSRLITGSGDKAMKVWDLHKGECLLTLHGHSGIVGSFSSGDI